MFLKEETVIWQFLIHNLVEVYVLFRLKINNTKFNNKSRISCSDGICKQMDGHNQIPLSCDTFKH